MVGYGYILIASHAMGNTGKNPGSSNLGMDLLLNALKEARLAFRIIEFSADAGLINNALDGEDKANPSAMLDDVSHHAQQAGLAIDRLLICSAKRSGLNFSMVK